MSIPVLQDLNFNDTVRILAIPNAVLPNQPATLGQLNSLSSGLNWKDSCRVATTGNINLSSPGATIDGITLATNDRVLVKNQSAAEENGIYLYDTSTTPMVRDPLMDFPFNTSVEGAVVIIEEGTANAGVTYRQTQVNLTIGFDPLIWVTFGTAAPTASESTAGIAEIATQAETDTGTDDSRFVTPAKLANWSGRVKKYATLIGDGSATSYTVTHNLNTRDVEVAVYLNSGNYDKVIVNVRHTSVNTVTIVFATAPASNAYRVVVLG